MKQYTETHEWIDSENRVGITAYAASEMGEVVYIELPKVGTQVKEGDEVVILESTKAATDIASPISGTITEVNDSLKDDLTPLNKAPEGTWLFKLG